MLSEVRSMVGGEQGGGQGVRRGDLGSYLEPTTARGGAGA